MNRYIYKVTHIPSGRYYIGQRLCHCRIEKDRYWGSGTDWYNNGIEQVMAKTCPEGFVEGRLSWKTN